MTSIHRFLTVSSLCLAAVLPLSAVAQSSPAPAKKGNVLTLGKGQGKGALLTRDQLRACLKEQAEIKTAGADAVKAQSEVDAKKAEVDKVTEALQAQRATLDATNEAAVNEFNAKVREREALIDGYNAALPAFNTMAKAYQERQANWQRDCADRPYDEADYFAIQRGK